MTIDVDAVREAAVSAFRREASRLGHNPRLHVVADVDEAARRVLIRNAATRDVVLALELGTDEHGRIRLTTPNRRLHVTPSAEHLERALSDAEREVDEARAARAKSPATPELEHRYQRALTAYFHAVASLHTGSGKRSAA